MRRPLPCIFLLAGMTIPGTAYAQSQASKPAGAQPSFTADYPQRQAGVLIQDSSWENVVNQTPTKTKVAHGFAASISYGLVPGKIVAEYEGPHAPTQVNSDQPTICICTFSPSPASR